MRKKRMLKKGMSLLLTFAILIGIVGIGLPFMKINVSAAGTITTSDGTNETITQTTIVNADNAAVRNETYAQYAHNYGANCSEPTNIVVPGLSDANNYVIQGMAYYAKRDWILVTAYHAEGTYSSKVFCLDAVTGEFVAMISFKNPDGSVNYDHGGGIALSEQNIYYSCNDKDRFIAYAPLSDLDGMAIGEHRVVQLRAREEFFEVGSITDGGTAYTAYVCYDQGVLWMGNFYDPGALGSNIAADYSIPANDAYNTMIFGYRLSGETPEQEWANLTAGTDNCQGSPSYTIGIPKETIHNDPNDGEVKVKDVQYAAVHDGKLYLSSSYGSGSGNSITFGFYRKSYFRIADIDLSLPGTKQVSIRYDGTNFKTVNAFEISQFQHIPMPPMIEGLCVLDGYIYTTFESASKKYRADSGSLTGIGNCQTPIDVVWKIDQYKALGIERPVPEKTIHYEEVTNANFSPDDQYIIAYESNLKNPVTQKPYLYALNTEGGYHNYRLSKNATGGQVGYAGMRAHAITDYNIEDGILYLNNMDADDGDNIHWSIDSNGYIKSLDSYFITYPYLCANGNTISMAQTTKAKLDYVGDGGSIRGGKFYLQSGGNYMWCYDGEVPRYATAINNWYSTQTSRMYYGATATPGMFYSDALSGANVAGEALTDFSYGQFRVFKRVIDEYASTAETRIYTDMDAELQSDGTYTVTLETYATGTTQNIKVNQRPTDFIFVLDSSKSMLTRGATGYEPQPYFNLDAAGGQDANAGDEEIAEHTSNSTNSNTIKVYEQGSMYMVHTDGVFCPVGLKVQGDGRSGSFFNYTYYQKVYLWYTHPDTGVKYWYHPGTNTWTTTETTYDEAQRVGANTKKKRMTTTVYTGRSYQYKTNATRFATLQSAVEKLIGSIRTNATTTGLNHRIALVQYGSDGVMYTNNGTPVQYNNITVANYQSAFFDMANIETARTALWNITATDSANTYSNYGFDIANGIIDNSGQSYLSDGDRSVAVIMITDGFPGDDGGDLSSLNAAANATVAESLKAKQKGASVYSVVMRNSDRNDFNVDLYRDYVSSNFPDAKNMSDSGNRNENGVEYSVDIQVNTTDSFVLFADSLFASIQNNSTNGLAKLDESTVLKEHLSTAFKLPANASDWDVKAYLVPGLYDAVGRVSFHEDQAKETTAVTVAHSTDPTDNSTVFNITGFDYSDNYVAKGSTNGNKLRVTITGLLANELADITNTSINNTVDTAIYHGPKNQVAKKFPTAYFNIPTYNFVLDYDLPMYDADVNGTLCSVDGGLNKQSTYKDERVTDNIALRFVNNNLDMTYELESGVATEAQNSSYCLIKRGDGSYDWFRINIVPATNVLFEETRFERSTAGSLTKSEWKSEGTPLETYQTLSGDNDYYGYDANYSDHGNNHSNGTVIKAQVDSTTKRSETMKFSYTGTGFDLMSACAKNTGIQMVTVKIAEPDPITGKRTVEKVYLVDTYYDDPAHPDLIKQVPIVRHENEIGIDATTGTGTYIVEVTAAYLTTAQGVTGGRATRSSNGALDSFSSVLSDEYTVQKLLKQSGLDVSADEVELVWFDDNSILNGGTGPVAKGAGDRATGTDVTLDCYLDGVRVYNPLGNENSFYLDSEKDPTYYNIVGELEDTKDGVITDDGKGLFAYVVGNLEAGEDGTDPVLTFQNYQSVGPQHELYLEKATGAAKSHAVSFNVSNLTTDSRVMISLRAVNGATTVKVASGANAYEFAINTATEQYFDITPYLTVTNGVANVVITNTGDGLLSVNNLKLVGASAQAISVDDMEAMSIAFAAAPTVVEPNSHDYKANVNGAPQLPGTDGPVDDGNVDDGNNDVDNGNDNVEEDNTDDNSMSIFDRIKAFFSNLFATIKNFFGNLF